MVAEPRAGQGFEFSRRFHLKEDWSAVDQARGLGMDSPVGGGDGAGEKTRAKIANGID